MLLMSCLYQSVCSGYFNGMISYDVSGIRLRLKLHMAVTVAILSSGTENVKYSWVYLQLNFVTL